MCLPIAVKRPEVVLAKGEHLGFEWNIIHNDMGFRCGYVRVPKGHPWFDKDYNDINADVHGGLTFAAMDMPCDKGGPDDGYWVGFDCGHFDDAPDPALPILKARKDFALAWVGGVVRSQAYVEEQCRSLCQQAKEAMP